MLSCASSERDEKKQSDFKDNAKIDNKTLFAHSVRHGLSNFPHNHIDPQLHFGFAKLSFNEIILQTYQFLSFHAPVDY